MAEFDKEKLIEIASEKLGLTKEGLREMLRTGNVSAITSNLSQSDREKVEKVDTTLPVTRALAKKYLNINCSVMSPNQSRMDYIRDMIDEYQVDGVLELVLQACHTYAIEAFYVKKAATEKGVPYLNIETDYSTADSGQINTRLEAFLETIDL